MRSSQRVEQIGDLLMDGGLARTFVVLKMGPGPPEAVVAERDFFVFGLFFLIFFRLDFSL